MNITIINGPNLNLTGNRETDLYGTMTFDVFVENLKRKHSGIKFTYFQSNHEGEIIDKLHQCNKNTDGVIINPGAYSHTSIAIADAIKAINTPVVEVHITNIHAREPFRHHSITGANCVGIITGLRMESYSLAVDYFVHYREQKVQSILKRTGRKGGLQ